MNALYLTYAILAAIYFLLRKKWDTHWLRRGDCLFLALSATLMLLSDLTDFLVTYYSGYLFEMLAFVYRTYGNLVAFYWIGLIGVQVICLFNYAKRFRKKKTAQLALWGSVICILLATCYQQQNLDIYFPFEFHTIQRPNEPGWYTTIGGAFLPLFWILFFFPFGAGISAFLGWFLKNKHERKESSV